MHGRLPEGLRGREVSASHFNSFPRETVTGDWDYVCPSLRCNVEDSSKLPWEVLLSHQYDFLL